MKEVAYTLGGLYLLITIIHFGFQYYDLDRLISNVAIALGGILYGYFYDRVNSTDNDIKMIDYKLNNLEVKVIEMKGGD